ncbi:MAG: DNA recombination protein RmuC [Bdellovibrionales bacterium]|jgi:DNA recombination protein RmuC|nr:DNA recombination protein RmuC [Bdellovibrionales bacterium]
MELYLLVAACFLSGGALLAVVFFGARRVDATRLSEQKLSELTNAINRLESNFKEDLRINRQESFAVSKDSREALTSGLREFSLTLENSLRGFQGSFDKNVESFNSLQREKFGQLEFKQAELIKNTEMRLDQIRGTVEEKLEKTLSERLGQSFEIVGKQLNEVQKGLGEMQVLAQDVGGLKKVLNNVKMRGGIGEVQLEMLLEQILAPDQYQANVKTKIGSSEVVEFAIKLPGRGKENSPVWIPIDAKFPKDVYETLVDAYEKGDLGPIELAQKNLDTTIKKMAKDISEKYLDPPNTTDFGIMFLPFEGIFAEVVRKSALLEDLQRNHKIIVTGPTTLASILNSLHMGFKTLAIEKRSSEVWQVLGAVKKEFESFGGLMQKAQGNIQTGLNQLDEVLGVRTRAIQRRLKGVESLTAADAVLVLGHEKPTDLGLADE